MAKADIRRHFYKFGPFLLHVEEPLLLRDGECLTLEPQIMKTLRVLVENHHHLLTKTELMESIWPNNLDVHEESLTKSVSKLREGLGDSHEPHKYVVTVRSRGYMFVAHVDFVIDFDATSEADSENLGTVSTFRSSSLSNQDWLNEGDKNLLIAFEDSNRVLRSPESLARDTGMASHEVRNVLGQLRARELVELKRVENGRRWYITVKGQRLLAAARCKPQSSSAQGKGGS